MKDESLDLAYQMEFQGKYQLQYQDESKEAQNLTF
jgi:hypothetical protein